MMPSRGVESKPPVPVLDASNLPTSELQPTRETQASPRRSVQLREALSQSMEAGQQSQQARLSRKSTMMPFIHGLLQRKFGSNRSFTDVQKASLVRQKSKKVWVNDNMGCLERLRHRVGAWSESLTAQVILVVLLATDLGFTLQLYLQGQVAPPEWSPAILIVLWFDILCRIFARGLVFFVGKGRYLNIFELCTASLCLLAQLVQYSVSSRVLSAIRIFSGWLRFCISLSQQKDRLLQIANQHARMKILTMLMWVMGDFVFVEKENLYVDPVAQLLQMKRAEVNVAAFAGLDVPVTITGGIMDLFEIEAPVMAKVLGWQSGSQEPLLKLRVHNALLLLGPCCHDGDLPGRQQSRAKVLDMIHQRLEVFGQELLPVDPAQPAHQPAASPATVATGLASLKNRMVAAAARSLSRNATISIINVSVRFENMNADGSWPVSPLICGFSLWSLRITTSMMDEDLDGHDDDAGWGRLMIKTASAMTRVATSRMRRQEPEPSTPKDQDEEEHAFRKAVRSSAKSLSAKHGMPVRVQVLQLRHCSVFVDTDPTRSFKAILDGGGTKELLLKFVRFQLQEQMKLRAVDRISPAMAHLPHKKRLFHGPMFRERLDQHRYVLFPLSAHGSLLWPGPDDLDSAPPFQVSLEVSPLLAAVDDRQIASLNQLALVAERWLIDHEVIRTQPSRGILELKGKASAEAHHHHVRSWWRHTVRMLQLRLDIRPRSFGRRLEKELAPALKAEYVDLLVEDCFSHRMAKSRVKRNMERRLEIQMALPLVSLLQSRFVAMERLEALQAFKDETARHFALHAHSDKPLLAFCWRKLCPRKEDLQKEEEEEVIQDIEAQVKTALEQAVQASEGKPLSEEAEQQEQTPLSWSHVCEMKISFQMLQFFLLEHSLWGSLAEVLKSAEGTKPGPVPPKGFVGGFGLERFGLAVSPRRPVISATFSHCSCLVLLPESAFGGSAAGSVIDLSCREVSVTGADPKLSTLKPIVGLKPIVAEDASGNFDCQPTTKKPTCQLRFEVELDGDTENSLVFARPRGDQGLVATLQSASWKGDLHVGEIHVDGLLPLAGKLRHILQRGRLMTQSQQEFTEDVKGRLGRQSGHAGRVFPQGLPRRVDLAIRLDASALELLERYRHFQLLAVSIRVPVVTMTVAWDAEQNDLTVAVGIGENVVRPTQPPTIGTALSGIAESTSSTLLTECVQSSGDEQRLLPSVPRATCTRRVPDEAPPRMGLLQLLSCGSGSCGGQKDHPDPSDCSSSVADVRSRSLPASTFLLPMPIDIGESEPITIHMDESAPKEAGFRTGDLPGWVEDFTMRATALRPSATWLPPEWVSRLKEDRSSTVPFPSQALSL